MSENISFITVGRITRPHGIRGEVCAQYYAESFSYLDNGQARIKTEKSAPKPFSVSSWRMQGTILILKLKGVETRTDAEFLRNYDVVIDEKLLTYIVPDNKNLQHNDGDNSFSHDDKNENESYNSGCGDGRNANHEYYDDSDDTDYDAPFLHHILGAKAIIRKTQQNTELSISVTGAEEKSAMSEELYLKEESFTEKEYNTEALNTKGLSTNELNTDKMDVEELGIIEEITFPAGQELWTIINNKGQEILFPAVSHFIDYYDLANNKVYINPPEGLIDLYLSEAQMPIQEQREMKKRQNAHKNKPLCGEGKKQNKPKSQINTQKKQVQDKQNRVEQKKQK